MKEEILSFLPPDFSWGESLYVYDTIDSTNAIAKALAEKDAPEGTAVIARCQTGGRGRMGRSFHSPDGGLYLTVILRPQCRAEELLHLTCAAGVAAAEAVFSAAGVQPGLKWINDLVLNRRKLGGILAELSFAPSGAVSYALIGIGINCAHHLPPELSGIATSLEAETGKATSPAALAAALLTSLCKLSRELLTEKTAIMDTYRSLCVTCGKDVLLLRGDETQPARALRVDDDGSLLVEYPDKTRHRIQSGEASVRGLFGYSS